MITKCFLVKLNEKGKKNNLNMRLFFEALSREQLIRLFWQCELQIQLLNQ